MLQLSFFTLFLNPTNIVSSYGTSVEMCASHSINHISYNINHSIGDTAMTLFQCLSRAAVAMCLLFLWATAWAHDWSAAQKDVWKTVEAYNGAFDKGDIETFMSYFHSEYRGWIYTAPVPSDKATVRKFVEYAMKSSKVLFSNLTPAEISIFGNVAIVHYFWTSVEKGADGKEETNSGRWTDVLMKQGDKWMLIGDHGGRTPGN